MIGLKPASNLSLKISRPLFSLSHGIKTAIAYRLLPTGKRFRRWLVRARLIIYFSGLDGEVIIMNCPHCNLEIESHRNPTPTVDIIIEIKDQIVLIERKNPPYGWALPGGFVDYGESYEAAALREAKEETGLTVLRLRQFRTYSNPDRDPRSHTASTVFIGQAEGSPYAGDDASNAELFSKDKLPQLAFDHADILEDYFKDKE